MSGWKPLLTWAGIQLIFLNLRFHDVARLKAQVHNAKKVARFKKGYDPLPKNDP